MHIPDGYLSPATCGVMGAAMVPVWVTAGRRVRRVVKSRYVPYVALGASYSFLVMMFNVPIPDGTTAHAVGGVLDRGAARAVGRGDRGERRPGRSRRCSSATAACCAFGANCFNMAFVMPFVGYGVYRLLAATISLTSPAARARRRRRRATSASTPPRCARRSSSASSPSSSQPADGTPLYAPFHLSQTIPAMALAHLHGGRRRRVRARPSASSRTCSAPTSRSCGSTTPTCPPPTATVPGAGRSAGAGRSIGLGAMVVLTPLGLLAPGGAFGEDTPGDLDLRQVRPRRGADRPGTDASRSGTTPLFDGYGLRTASTRTLGYLRVGRRRHRSSIARRGRSSALRLRRPRPRASRSSRRPHRSAVSARHAA